ncbi:hypothetical protein HispidOSU_026776, partial [Sigmodon hispidus]
EVGDNCRERGKSQAREHNPLPLSTLGGCRSGVLRGRQAGHTETQRTGAQPPQGKPHSPQQQNLNFVPNTPNKQRDKKQLYLVEKLSLVAQL